MLTNRYGNHIVMQLSGGNNSIKYYLINSQGSIIRSVILESSANGEFPDIDGNNDIIFVTYRLGSKIIVKYTNNNGQDWNSFQSPHNFSTNLCNSLDIEYFEQGNSGNNGLHIVWSLRDSYPNYKTYYYQFDLNNNFFNHYEVTNYPGEVGGFATVAVNNEIILVNYNTGYQLNSYDNLGVEKSRIKYLNQWLEPQNITNFASSSRGRVFIYNGKMFAFYYDYWWGPGVFGYNLKFKTKVNVYENWANEQQITQIKADPNLLVLIEKTFNGKMNLIYEEYFNDEIRNGNYLIHQTYDNLNWSEKTYIYGSDSDPNKPELFSFGYTSNDLFVIWKEYSLSNVKFRQYDAAPLAPTNLTVTTSPDNHPKLQWARNNEADIVTYKVYKYKYSEQGWYALANVNSSLDYFIDSTEKVTSGPVQAKETYVYYKITAVDYKPYESPFSNTVNIRVYGYPMEKINPENIKDFYLENNYPNPFNPETKIRFSIPSKIKSSVNVRLNIYNSLGQHIGEIINDYYDSGIYEVTINSDKLFMQSGVYYYEFRAGEFSSIKKMVLIK